jgi:hypothetical protein
MAEWGINRYLFRLFIPELARLGLSANESIKFARNIGISYRRKDMLADWRNVLNISKQVDVLKSIRKEFAPSLETFVPVPKAFKQAFQYVGRIDYYTRENVFTSRTVSFLSDRIMTRNKIEETLSQIAIDSGDKYALKDIVNVEWTGAYRSSEF